MGLCSAICFLGTVTQPPWLPLYSGAAGGWLTGAGSAQSAPVVCHCNEESNKFNSVELEQQKYVTSNTQAPVTGKQTMCLLKMNVSIHRYPKLIKYFPFLAVRKDNRLTLGLQPAIFVLVFHLYIITHHVLYLRKEVGMFDFFLFSVCCVSHLVQHQDYCICSALRRPLQHQFFRL